MPAARIWTEAEDARLREIGGAVTAERVASEFGCCRQCVIDRERRLGIERCVRKPRGTPDRPTRSKYFAAVNYPRDEFPLPAGHPETWGAMNRGTVLEGEPWPR